MAADSKKMLDKRAYPCYLFRNLIFFGIMMNIRAINLLISLILVLVGGIIVVDEKKGWVMA